MCSNPGRLPGVAAGGMGRASDGPRLPLAQRRLGGRPRPEPPDDGRPCWVEVGGRRVRGRVHSWLRDEDSGEWQALVVAWLPAAAVSPRED